MHSGTEAFKHEQHSVKEETFFKPKHNWNFLTWHKQLFFLQLAVFLREQSECNVSHTEREGGAVGLTLLL